MAACFGITAVGGEFCKANKFIAEIIPTYSDNRERMLYKSLLSIEGNERFLSNLWLCCLASKATRACSARVTAKFFAGLAGKK